jgi:uncharacterized damage-inducible protein DinB
MAAMSGTSSDLTREADRLFDQYLHKIEHCVALLTPAQVWWRPNSKSNSVGNLLLHLCGNLSQWVLDGLGGRAYERHRREEFAAAEGEDGAALVGRLATIVAACRAVARGLTTEELVGERTIQGISHNGFGVLLHAVEHMAYHTGQVVYVTKQLVGDGVEIEFYPNLK